MADSNNFIVTIYEFKDNRYEKYGDGFILLKDDGAISIKYTNNKDTIITLIEDNVKNDSVYILSHVKTSNNTFDFEINISSIKYGIRFDSSSSSSQDIFKKEFNKIKLSVLHQTKYASGNIHIEGKTLDGEFDGHCIEYYDNSNNRVKYIGEFENDQYDGAGSFYSQDGLIKLVLNNICSGTPNGMGELFVGDKLYKIVNWDDNRDLSQLNITVPTFTEDVLKIVSTIDYNSILDKAKFNTMGSDEKMSLLFDEIYMLKLTLNHNQQRQSSGLLSSFSFS